MKTLVDYFAILGVEHCILDDLASVFPPSIVAGLGDELVQEIAAETEGAQAERFSLNQKLEILGTSLKTGFPTRRHRYRLVDNGSNSPVFSRLRSE